MSLFGRICGSIPDKLWNSCFFCSFLRVSGHLKYGGQILNVPIWSISHPQWFGEGRNPSVELKDGSVREHMYYRCANNHPGPDHPRVRWKADDLERAIVDDLARMRLASPELAAWLRTELQEAVTDLTAYRRQQASSLAKRKRELATMQDRLLNAYLAGTVDEDAYRAKSNELKAEAANADETLSQLGDVGQAHRESAVVLFDWTQNAAEIWRGSNNAVRREILDAVCLNRTLTDVNLYATKRKPFDVFAKGLEIKKSRGEPICTMGKISISRTDVRRVA